MLEKIGAPGPDGGRPSGSSPLQVIGGKAVVSGLESGHFRR